MKIESYKKKGTNLYELSLSNNKKVKLYDEIILKYDLLISGNIKDSDLDKIIHENNLVDAYYKGLKYIGVKMRTKKEIREYLKRNEYFDDEIEYAIDKLTKDGYINEKEYTDAYVNDAINLGLMGPSKIKFNLKKLGISDKYIDSKLNSVSDKIWIDKINKIIDKKLKSNKYSEYIFKNKMYTYLISNGFNSEMISNILNNLNMNTDEIFYKEADKVWDNLSKKYKDNELKYKFKSKMYSKGYNGDLISSYIDNK